MHESIKPGLAGRSELVVARENTARHLGSGGVEVLATPELVRLMERAAVAAVDHLLPEGYRTVGARVDVQHLAPTPVGMRVVASAELVAVDGRRLTFQVEAHDERELVGRGSHERAIIELARFAQRVEQKR
ncbi:MAG: thioesterase family protein [Anaerolineae bacterium]|nr:thioesterase family protein [Anaerolineae bacterium]